MKKINHETADIKSRELILWIIGMGLLFPLFFQISGRIYHSLDPVIDSGGLISQLPLPISVLVCYGSLALLAVNYRRASIALKVLVCMTLAMGLSLFLAAPKIEPRKVILFIQIILPVSGLVLGQLVEDKNKIIPKAFLVVLLLIVPGQLVAGWMRHNFGLTHNMYFFSIYQHYQFVPLILVCAFTYSMSMLWDTFKKVFYFLTPLMYIYTIASLSMLTLVAFISFISAFSFSRFKGFKKITAIILILIFIAGVPTYFSIVESWGQNNQSKSNLGLFQYEGKFGRMQQGKTPKNVGERLEDWKLYGSGIVESAKTVFLGHPEPLPREVKTSAHNWYLDMMYNFGLISVLPIVLLMIYTLYLLWQGRGTWPPGMVWLVAIVFYLVVIDSNFKVTLRQPYPGIFSFFMWGVLLSSLKHTPSECDN